MCEISEYSLDRHYASQLRMMCDVLSLKPKCSESKICNLWLQRFDEADKEDKYARNCLVLLMYSQLKVNGKLVKPFTKLENINRTLYEVLTEYDETYAEKISETETDTGINVSSFEHCSRTCIKCTEMPSKQDILLSELGQQGQAKTVQSKQLQGQSLVKKVERNALLAIKQLKNWTTASGTLNFFATTLHDFLTDEPEMRRQLLQLDLKLERVLDTLLEQAGERREMNVRKLYDQLFKQQQDCIWQKERQLRSEQQDLMFSHQQLKCHVENLMQREQVYHNKLASYNNKKIVQGEEHQSIKDTAEEEDNHIDNPDYINNANHTPVKAQSLSSSLSQLSDMIFANSVHSKRMQGKKESCCYCEQQQSNVD